MRTKELCYVAVIFSLTDYTKGTTSILDAVEVEDPIMGAYSAPYVSRVLARAGVRVSKISGWIFDGGEFGRGGATYRTIRNGRLIELRYSIAIKRILDAAFYTQADLQKKADIASRISGADISFTEDGSFVFGETVFPREGMSAAAYAFLLRRILIEEASDLEGSADAETAFLFCRFFNPAHVIPAQKKTAPEEFNELILKRFAAALSTSLKLAKDESF